METINPKCTAIAAARLIHRSYTIAFEKNRLCFGYFTENASIFFYMNTTGAPKVLDWESQIRHKQAIDAPDANFSTHFPIPPMFKSKQEYTGHSDVVEAVSWLNENEFLSASLDGSIRIWSLTSSNKCSRHLRLFRGGTAIYDFRMLKKRTHGLVALSHDPFIALVDLGGNGVIQKTYDCMSNGPVMAVDCDTSESVIVSGNKLGGCLLHDINSKTCIQALREGSGDVIVDVKMNPLDSHLTALAFHKGEVQAFDTRGKKDQSLTASFKGSLGQLSCIEYVNSNYLLTGGDDYIVRQFDLRRPSDAVNCFLGHTSSISCLKIDPARNLLYSGSSDGSVRIWSLSNSSALGLPNQVEPAPVPYGNLKGGVKFLDQEKGSQNASNGLTDVLAIGCLSGHSQAIQCVDVNTTSKSGKSTKKGSDILTASSDTTLRHYSTSI